MNRRRCATAAITVVCAVTVLASPGPGVRGPRAAADRPGRRPRPKKSLEDVRKELDDALPQGGVRHRRVQPRRGAGRRSSRPRSCSWPRRSSRARRGSTTSRPRGRRRPRPVPRRRAAARGAAGAHRRPAALPRRRRPDPQGQQGDQGPARRTDPHPGRLGDVRQGRQRPVAEAGGQPRSSRRRPRRRSRSRSPRPRSSSPSWRRRSWRGCSSWSRQAAVQGADRLAGLRRTQGDQRQARPRRARRRSRSRRRRSASRT